MPLQGPRRFFRRKTPFLLGLPEGIKGMARMLALQALRGGGEVDGLPGLKGDIEDAGHEQVFLKIEAAFLLGQIFDGIIPVRRGAEDGCAVHLQEKRRQGGIRLDAHAEQGGGSGSGGRTAGVPDGVHVAAGQQGFEAQGQGGRLRAGDGSLIADEQDMAAG